MTTGTPQGYQYLNDQQEQPEVIVNKNSDTLDRLTGGGVFVLPWPSDADYTLATAPTGGEPPEWQYATIYCTDTGGVLSTDRNLFCPLIGKSYIIANGTSKKIRLRTAVTGKAGIQVNADRIEYLMAAENGAVFPIAGQVSLTPPT